MADIQDDDSLKNEEVKKEDKPSDENSPLNTAGSGIDNTAPRAGDEINSRPDNESKKTKDERKEDKDITEINLEQINTADRSDTQDNSADLHFYEKVQQLSIAINQSSKCDEPKLRFNDLRNLGYFSRLTTHETGFIQYHADILFPLLIKNRVVVINNQLSGEDVVMGMIESIVFNSIFSGRASAQICKWSDSVATLDEIINGFLEYKNKNGDSVKHRFLVIYGEKLNDFEFLASVLKKGGAADSIANLLRDENVFVIYVTNDTNLFKRVIRERAHFALIHLSEIHQFLFDNIANHDEYQNISALVETAVSEYDWLSAMSVAEKKEQINQLISHNEIVGFLTELIKSIDQEEAVKINNLLKDPIQGMVMLTAAFFEGITIGEFDLIVRQFATEHRDLARGQDTNKTLFDPSVAWEISADDILATCGVARKQTNAGKNSYSFASEARHQNTRKILTDKYGLTLQRRYEIIENKFFLQNRPLSESFVKATFELAMINARGDHDRYTTEVCIKLTDKVIDVNETVELSLFGRLLYFIKNWSVNAEHCSRIDGFYHQMFQSQERRGILGAVLSHLCEPLQPQTLSILKALVDASGNGEGFINLRLPRIVATNFRERLAELYVAIEGWADDANGDSVPRSYAFVKMSLLMVFYERRFSPVVATLEKVILASLKDGQTSSTETSLITFTFSSKTVSAFRKVFEKTISTQARTSNSSYLEIIHESSLFSFFAYILIRWYYLLTQKESIDIPTTKTPEEVIQEALQAILSLPGKKNLTLLQAALVKAIKKYNALIIQSKEQPKERSNKEGYKTLRDISRQLMYQTEHVINLKQQLS